MNIKQFFVELLDDIIESFARVGCGIAGLSYYKDQ
jgi:hypothetical protein